MDDLQIGKKLHDFRMDRGFSTRELAQKAGITASLLSQIERGITNPSINTLRDIAVALEVPIYCFFKNEESEETLIVRENERRLVGNRGSEVVYEMLTPGEMGTIEFILMRIPCGSSTSTNSLSHLGEETAFVMQGSVEITIEDSAYSLDEGDSIRIPAGSAHRWKNMLPKEAIVIFAVTPPTF